MQRRHCCTRTTEVPADLAGYNTHSSARRATAVVVAATAVAAVVKVPAVRCRCRAPRGHPLAGGRRIAAEGTEIDTVDA